jgi:DNA-binding IclR family transcriptional regulator
MPGENFLTTADRVLAVLNLFTMERPEWTVETAAGELDLSQSTAYQYFRSLVKARLLVAFKTGRYVIGPAIIELDRQMRALDPLIGGAAPTIQSLSESLQIEGLILLCRIYGRTVMCVDQHELAQHGFAVSYERGRPMPLIRGAASKVILAHLPPRVLHRYYDDNSAAIAAAGLGATWKAFQSTLRKLRKAVVCVSRGEVDRGFVGVSGPVFGPDDAILGSIGLVIRARLLDKSPELLSQLTAKVRQASDDLTAALKSNGAEAAPTRHPGAPGRKASGKSAKRPRKPILAGRKRRARRK